MGPQTAFTAAGSVLILDQVSKYLVGRYGPLQLNQISLEAWVNTAGPFSLPLSNIAAVVLTAAVISGLAAWLFCHPRTAGYDPVVIIGGGVSNLIDRAFHGGVVDILHIGSLATNLADIFITAALGLLALSYVRHLLSSQTR